MARRTVIQPSVHSSAVLRTAALGLKRADKELRRHISKATRDEGNVIWREEIDRAATTRMDRLVLVKGARIKAGNPAQAIAASSRRPLSDGLIPTDEWQGFEFGGTTQNEPQEYTRRSKTGGTHRVSRRVKANLPKKAQKGSGRVVYKAWYRSGPRLVSLWTQIIFRSVYEAFGEK